MELFEYLMNNKDTYFSSEYYLQISTIEKEIDKYTLDSIEKLINEIDSNKNIDILDVYYESDMLKRQNMEFSPYEFRHYSSFNTGYKLKEDCYIVFCTDENTYNWLIERYKKEILTLQLVNSALIKHSNKIINVLENKMIKYNTYNNEDFIYITHPQIDFEICRYLANHGINTNSSRIEVPTEIDDNILRTDILDNLYNDIRTTFDLSSELRTMFDSSNDERDNYSNGLRTSSISIDNLVFPITDTNIDSLHLQDADGDRTFIGNITRMDISDRPSITNVVADNISTSHISQSANSITSRIDNRLDNIESILNNATDRIGNLEDWRNGRDN